jgi:endonuclease YncB( thermonuclease family)
MRTFAFSLGAVLLAWAMLPVGWIDAIRDPQTIKVIDGDSLELNGRRIRLYGIDAPELTQWCEDERRQPYRCGLEAKRGLYDLVAEQRLTCVTVKQDQYGRDLSICKTRSGFDIAGAQVLNGYAVAYGRYTNQYRDEQAKAKEARRGIWRGPFEIPEQFRHKKTSPTV